MGQKQQYQPIFSRRSFAVCSSTQHADSFYELGLTLIESILSKEIDEDFGGVPTLFLVRHYLELALKEVLTTGRILTNGGRYNEDAPKPTERIHTLRELWDMVLSDAKPKFSPITWDQCDTEFVEQCVVEFDRVDRLGFAFRYSGEGGERVRADFARLRETMLHLRSILEEMRVHLALTWKANEEGSEPEAPEDQEPGEADWEMEEDRE